MQASQTKCSIPILLVCSILAAEPGASFCFDEAAARYGVAVELVRGISLKENRSQNPFAINRNTDGSYDYGLMQINTIHEPALRRLGIPWDSLADPCTNVMVGAWLLRQRINEYGYNWKAVGAYHSKTPSKRDPYALDIHKIITTSPLVRTQQAQAAHTGGQ